MSIEKVKINNALKFLIEKNNLNTMELARRTGVSQPVIYRLITGDTEDPKISTLCILADYFNISLDELVGRENKFSSSKNLGYPNVIPLLKWEDVVNFPEISDQKIKNYPIIYATVLANIHVFALRVRDISMEPKFCLGTIIVVDFIKKPKNNSYVLVKFTNHKEVVLRQLVIEANEKYLYPLSTDITKHKIKPFAKGDKLLGVVVHSISDF